ncbi:MAG: hypothetical protein K2J80_01435, partial [Oscillospiraceae bacterium]|nr:hypothetical protein [Oscillospiraceae bacterium]
KQNDILANSFTELMRIVDEIIDAKNTGGMPKALAFVRDNKARASEAVKNLRGVCDYFEKVKVPGKLKGELAAVRAGIPDMRRFLDKYENMFREVMLESEFLGYVREMSESVSFLEGDGNFIIAEQEFMRKLKRLKSRKGGLMWL